MCEQIVSKDLFLMFYCPDKYKTQRKCDEALDDCVAVLIFFLIGLLQVKLLKNCSCALHANDDILFNNVIFIANQIHTLTVDLNKSNLDNDNILSKDDPDTVIHVTLLFWYSKFEKHKTL